MDDPTRDYMDGDPNVALVVLDTLRKDSFDDLFQWLPGIRCSNAWSTGNWTVPAHASLFTGEYPSEVGVHAKNKELDTAESTLAEDLRAEGYRTVGFSTNTNVSRYWSFDRGFDRFYERLETGRLLCSTEVDWRGLLHDTEEGRKRYLDAIVETLRSQRPLRSFRRGLELKFYDTFLLGRCIPESDDAGAKAVLRHISDGTWKSGGPTFLFANLMEAHGPYDPPIEHRRLETAVNVTGLPESLGNSPDPDRVATAYTDSVTYLSEIYEDIYDELMTDFDYVITCSDHGELLGEHGYWAHEFGVFPELTHVPLVISGPDVPEGTHRSSISLRKVPDLIFDLLEGIGPKTALERNSESRCYAEFFGLLQWRMENHEDAGYPPASIEAHDEPLVGVYEDGYVYETLDGIEPHGDADVDSAKPLVDERNERLREHEPDDGSELPDSVRNQLENLGYA